MQIYAHRGWSSGPNENSLHYFERATHSQHLDGVEFDIRRHSDGRLVVVHDPIKQDQELPSLDTVLDVLEPTNLGLYVEIKEPDISKDVINVLRDRGLVDRSVVFGFPNSASALPWTEKRSIQLGLIGHLPWQTATLARQYRPDVLMAGWDKRPWVRRFFKTWWSVRSFKKIGDEINATTSGGIARSAADIKWLDRKQFDIATVDLHTNEGELLADGTPLEVLKK